MIILGFWEGALDFIYNSNLLNKTNKERYIEHIISTHAVTTNIVIPRQKDIDNFENTFNLYGIYYQNHFDFNNAINYFKEMKLINLNMAIEVSS